MDGAEKGGKTKGDGKGEEMERNEGIAGTSSSTSSSNNSSSNNNNNSASSSDRDAAIALCSLPSTPIRPAPSPSHRPTGSASLTPFGHNNRHRPAVNGSGGGKGASSTEVNYDIVNFASALSNAVMSMTPVTTPAQQAGGGGGGYGRDVKTPVKAGKVEDAAGSVIGCTPTRIDMYRHGGGQGGVKQQIASGGGCGAPIIGGGGVPTLFDNLVFTPNGTIRTGGNDNGRNCGSANDEVFYGLARELSPIQQTRGGEGGYIRSLPSYPCSPNQLIKAPQIQSPPFASMSPPNSDLKRSVKRQMSPSWVRIELGVGCMQGMNFKRVNEEMARNLYYGPEDDADGIDGEEGVNDDDDVFRHHEQQRQQHRRANGGEFNDAGSGGRRREGTKGNNYKGSNVEVVNVRDINAGVGQPPPTQGGAARRRGGGGGGRSGKGGSGKSGKSKSSKSSGAAGSSGNGASIGSSASGVDYAKGGEGNVKTKLCFYGNDSSSNKNESNGGSQAAGHKGKGAGGGSRNRQGGNGGKGKRSRDSGAGAGAGSAADKSADGKVAGAGNGKRGKGGGNNKGSNGQGGRGSSGGGGGKGKGGSSSSAASAMQNGNGKKDDEKPSKRRKSTSGGSSATATGQANGNGSEEHSGGQSKAASIQHSKSSSDSANFSSAIGGVGTSFSSNSSGGSSICDNNRENKGGISNLVQVNGFPGYGSCADAAAGNKGKDGKGKGKIVCNCKKSRCLKLYCECFTALKYCDGCNCNDCRNVPAYDSLRTDAIKATKAKNPNAFRQKISSSSESEAGGACGGHAMGCRCKKSACLKKYCECYEASVFCGDKCKCTGCLNYPGSEALVERRTKIKDWKGLEKAKTLPKGFVPPANAAARSNEPNQTAAPQKNAGEGSAKPSSEPVEVAAAAGVGGSEIGDYAAKFLSVGVGRDSAHGNGRSMSDCVGGEGISGNSSNVGVGGLEGAAGCGASAAAAAAHMHCDVVASSSSSPVVSYLPVVASSIPASSSSEVVRGNVCGADGDIMSVDDLMDVVAYGDISAGGDEVGGGGGSTRGDSSVNRTMSLVADQAAEIIATAASPGTMKDLQDAAKLAGGMSSISEGLFMPLTKGGSGDASEVHEIFGSSKKTTTKCDYEIFKFLAAKDLMNASCVSKGFKKATQNEVLWKLF